VALLHPTPETIALAPLYDTVPTVLWPRLRRQAAMSIGGQRVLLDVTLADIAAEARSWNHSARRAEAAAVGLVARVSDALDRDVVSSASPVGELVSSQIARLRAG